MKGARWSCAGLCVTLLALQLRIPVSVIGRELSDAETEKLQNVRNCTLESDPTITTAWHGWKHCPGGATLQPRASFPHARGWTAKTIQNLLPFLGSLTFVSAVLWATFMASNKVVAWRTEMIAAELPARIVPIVGSWLRAAAQRLPLVGSWFQAERQSEAPDPAPGRDTYRNIALAVLVVVAGFVGSFVMTVLIGFRQEEMTGRHVDGFTAALLNSSHPAAPSQVCYDTPVQVQDSPVHFTSAVTFQFCASYYHSTPTSPHIQDVVSAHLTEDYDVTVSRFHTAHGMQYAIMPRPGTSFYGVKNNYVGQVAAIHFVGSVFIVTRTDKYVLPMSGVGDEAIDVQTESILQQFSGCEVVKDGGVHGHRRDFLLSKCAKPIDTGALSPEHRIIRALYGGMAIRPSKDFVLISPDGVSPVSWDKTVVGDAYVGIVPFWVVLAIGGAFLVAMFFMSRHMTLEQVTDNAVSGTGNFRQRNGDATILTLDQGPRQENVAAEMAEPG